MTSARIEAEAVRVWAMLDAAIPPAECGPEIPAAPARRAMQTFTPREMVVTEAGNSVMRRSGYRARTGLRVADGFDIMTGQARKAQGRKGEGAPPFEPLFTNGQVMIGREYAMLTERCDAAGVKCSSMESLGGGGSQGGDREAAIFRDLQRLRVFHARIGTGMAKEVRRARPSASGGDKRRAIDVRRLVDMVCLGGLPLKIILKRHYWYPDAKATRDLRADLCRALDRMQGFDLDKPQNIA